MTISSQTQPFSFVCMRVCMYIGGGMKANDTNNTKSLQFFLLSLRFSFHYWLALPSIGIVLVILSNTLFVRNEGMRGFSIIVT